MKWSPHQYEKFAAARLRPAQDLLGRIDISTPKTLVDLGCGPGNITPYIKARWPGAHYTGIDNSSDMLACAKAQFPLLDWVETDIKRWQSPAPPDLIYSNAALHWVKDHQRLFPHLIRQLRKDGILAVQMPRSLTMPVHTLARDVANQPPFRERIPTDTQCVMEPDFYYDVLAQHCAEIDIWETEYLQQLEGEDPVLEWARGTTLLPAFEALKETSERYEFVRRYRNLLRTVYPPRADGMTLFPFKRLFIVARR